MDKKRKRGAALIMSMMAICLAFMMLGVLLQTSGFSLRDSSSFYDREAALLAAQSGMDYAVTRLQKNSGWRGDSNCKYWNDNDAAEKIYGFANNIQVAESFGNVVGLIRRQSGGISIFRIKFSYEDNDSATLDKVKRSRFGKPGSNKSLPKYSIKSPFVSVNNLQSVVQVPVYRAEDDGTGVAAKTDKLEFDTETIAPAPDNSVAFHILPKRVYLVVEGLAGVGLRDCRDFAEANEIANSSSNVVRRYIEACYTSTPPVLQGDAAFANGNIKFNVHDKLLVSTKTVKASTLSSDMNVTDDFGTCPSPGSLRSNTGDITVAGSKKLNTFNGKAILPADNTLSYIIDPSLYVFMDSKGKYRPMSFGITSRETAETAVEAIKWDDVGKAEDKEENKLTPGFYQWQRTPGSTPEAPRYSLLFYPDGYNVDAKGRPVPKNAGNFQIAVAGPAAEAPVDYGGKQVQQISMGPAGKIIFEQDETGIKTPSVTLLGNLYCDKDFAVGSDLSQSFSSCPSVHMLPYSSEEKNENGVLTVNGSAYIAASVSGSGSIVTQKDITLMGSTVIDSGDNGVAVYGDNVNLKSLDLTSASSDLLLGDFSNNNSDKIVFGREFFDMLDASWHSHQNYWNGLTAPDPADVTDYFQQKLGIRAVCPHPMSSAPTSDIDPPRTYKFRVDLYDEHNSQVKSYWFKTTVNATTVRETEAENPCTEYKDYIQINDCVKLSNYNNKSKNMQDHVDAFGSLHYGDQIFNGIIYAKKNFTANLGDKFHLTVNGSICVEEGGINVEECKGANLCYDETYIRQLLPGYSALHRVMWHCW